MSFFDFFLLAVIVYSVVKAFLRGFLREIFYLLGLIVGIVLAGFYYERVSVTLSRWITTVPIAHATAFLGILATVIVISALLGRLMKRTASTIGLGFMDRLLGALFGLGRGCLFGVAIMMSVAAFFPGATWVQRSVLAPYLLRGAHAVSFVVPRDLRQQISTGVQSLLQSPALHALPLKVAPKP